MAYVANGIDYKEIEKQLAAFRETDATRDAFLNTLLQRYHDLSQRYDEKCLDYDNEVKSRRDLQSTVTYFEKELSATRNLMHRKQFVLAVFDGDGALFQDELLEKIGDGGAEAAHRLMVEIQKYIRELYDGDTDYQIMVQIYLNQEGLARKLYACGKIASSVEFNEFIRSFTINQPLFSIVDVGSGKERADYKLREMFRLMLDNIQCKHIIFGGCCHDNGYLRLLEPLQHDALVASKVTLLETFRTEPGFYKLRDLYNFRMTKFQSIFRHDPLPEKPPAVTSRTMSLPTLPAPAPAQPAILQAAAAAQAVLAQRPAPSVTSPPPTTVPTITPTIPTISPAQTPPVPTSNSYASIGGPAAPSNPISIAPTPPKRFCYLNNSQERIDPPLQKVPQSDISALFARISKKKLCNEYWLRGKCFNMEVGACDFDHEGSLAANQKLALRQRTRRLACTMGTDCRDVTCYRGHQCSFGAECTAQNCPFDDEQHYVEIKPAYKYFEDGSMQRY